jgi:hypothetical protein
MQQFGVGERKTGSGQGADEFLVLTSVIVDQQSETFPGKVKPKVEFQIQVGEWGDVEMLHGPQGEGALLGDRYKVGLPLSEGVADFGHGGQRFSLPVEAEEYRDGIEDMTENPRECQQEDFSDRSIDSLLPKVAEDILPSRGSAVGDVIGITEGIESGAVHPEKAQAPVEFPEFVEIEQEVKDAVEEFMLFGSHPPVKDSALVEA